MNFAQSPRIVWKASTRNRYKFTVTLGKVSDKCVHCGGGYSIILISGELVLDENHMNVISDDVDYTINPMPLVYILTVTMDWADAIQFFEKVAQRNKFKRLVINARVWRVWRSDWSIQ